MSDKNPFTHGLVISHNTPPADYHTNKSKRGEAGFVMSRAAAAHS